MSTSRKKAEPETRSTRFSVGESESVLLKAMKTGSANATYVSVSSSMYALHSRTKVEAGCRQPCRPGRCRPPPSPPQEARSARSSSLALGRGACWNSRWPAGTTRPFSSSRMTTWRALVPTAAAASELREKEASKSSSAPSPLGGEKVPNVSKLWPSGRNGYSAPLLRDMAGAAQRRDGYARAMGGSAEHGRGNARVGKARQCATVTFSLGRTSSYVARARCRPDVRVARSVGPSVRFTRSRVSSGELGCA